MEKIAREKFNSEFTKENYTNFINDINTAYNFKINFRVAETPIFIDKSFKNKLIEAGESVIETLLRKDFKSLSDSAIPNNLKVPNEDNHTTFLALDFAICKDDTNEYIPQLIELQGFPSLYSFEDFIANKYRTHFSVPENSSHLFNNYSWLKKSNY